MPLAGLLSWRSLSTTRRQQEFARVPRLAKGWKSLEKKRSKLPADQQVCCRPVLFAAALTIPTLPIPQQESLRAKDVFVYNLIQRFATVLSSIKEAEPVPPHALDYCQRFLELLVDVEVGSRPARA